MKTQKFVNWIMIVVMAFSTLGIMAQAPQGKNDKKPLAYLELNDKQDELARKFHAEMAEKIAPLKEALKLKEVELDKLIKTDDPKEEDVFAKVEEIGVLKTGIQKLQVQNAIWLRGILTPEQKVKFDAHVRNPEKKDKKKPGNKKMK